MAMKRVISAMAVFLLLIAVFSPTLICEGARSTPGLGKGSGGGIICPHAVCCTGPPRERSCKCCNSPVSTAGTQANHP
ncbi:hypothetical protein MRB53_012131 [Persea americana]|uniref:Uncharacterized protein n=1 Tax=Persea americana TaxID=3435 RepID=A0ACC2LWZ8_PERAE|nr:hypothetical protein MRB53_012131 [Persea americana]